MRGALYIRVSTEDQAAEGYSLAAQLHDLKAYCARKQYDVAEVYADEGISAKDIDHRPAFQQLLRDAQARQFDVVVVMRLTRLTRSIRDLSIVVELLIKAGVELECVYEAIDMHTPGGRLMLHMLGVFAQWEREMVADNVRCAAAERARQGLPTFSQMLGYDFAGRNLRVINLEEADRVRMIYRAYLETGSLAEVSRICSKLYIRGKRGGKLSPENIRIILTRFAYCGYYSYKRQPIKGDARPILDIETYHAVQRMMEEKGRRMGRKRIYPLVYLEE